MQAEVADRIYLSSFTPLNDASDLGRPSRRLSQAAAAVSDGKPDRKTSRTATPPAVDPSSCWIWDAGAAIQDQAPRPTDLTAATVDARRCVSDLADTQRRVFYTQAGRAAPLPSTLRLFAPPTGDPKTDHRLDRPLQRA